MLVNEIFSTPIKILCGIVAAGVLLILLGQFTLFFFDYGVERMYLNKNVQILQEEMSNNGGLQNYENNNFYYTTNFNPSTFNAQGGSGKALTGIVNEMFVHTQSVKNDDYATGKEWSEGRKNLVIIDININRDTVRERLQDAPFFYRTKYTVDVNVDDLAYIGRTVTLTVHRDLGFKFFWSIPVVIRLSGQAEYTYSDVYNPSQSIGRESGGIYIG